jgi:alpha-tubulin suppressor-like RCC1 family protein
MIFKRTQLGAEFGRCRKGLGIAKWWAWVVISCFVGVSRVDAGGSVVAWGAGKFVTKNPSDLYDYGQSIIPTNLVSVAMVAGGRCHSLAVKNDGTLVGWGQDLLGQTDFSAATTNEWAISCGALHSLALNTNSTVAVAGDNDYRQTSVPAGLSNVVAVAAGFYHSLGLRSDGTVSAWGMSTNAADIGTDPNYGQCRVPPEATNVVAIAGGGYHSLALRADGTVIGWGKNDFQQINVPAGLSNVVAIAAGAAHSMALREDGTVTVWGQNDYNQTNVPAGLSNVVAIAAGGWHCLALRSDGSVLAWGAGTTAVNTNLVYGQSTVPPGLTNVVQIAAGWVHSLAVVGSAPPVVKAFLTNPSIDANGFSLFVPTRNGRVYQLEYKKSLQGDVWTALPLHAGNGGELRLVDPSNLAGQRYYRVEQW